MYYLQMTLLMLMYLLPTSLCVPSLIITILHHIEIQVPLETVQNNQSTGYLVNDNTLVRLSDPFIGINWNTVLHFENLDIALRSFYNVLLEKFHLSIPKLPKKIFYSTDWITPDLNESILLQNTLARTARRHSNEFKSQPSKSLRTA